MSNPIRNVIHIKNRTAGTSNELSFDVLDAKRTEADVLAEGRRRKRLFGRIRKKNSGSYTSSQNESPKTGMPSLYTNDSSITQKGVAGVSGPYSDPDAEITRRKKKRLHSRWLSVFLIVAVIAGFSFIIASEASTYFASQSDYEASLNAALQIVAETDKTTVAMDELLSQSLSNMDKQKAEQLLKDAPTVQNQLTTALEQAKHASKNINNSSGREAAEQAVRGISARQEMVSRAVPIIEKSIAAKEACALMDQSWQLILEADTLTDEAAELVVETSETNVKASMDKNNAAIEKFGSAADLVASVHLKCPDADVSAYEDYISKRLDGQRAALESDQSILLKDRESAQASNKALYDNDSQAAEIAKGFPIDPAQPVLDAYEVDFSSSYEGYLQARSQAASADSHIRDYLGAQGK